MYSLHLLYRDFNLYTRSPWLAKRPLVTKIGFCLWSWVEEQLKSSLTNSWTRKRFAFMSIFFMLDFLLRKRRERYEGRNEDVDGTEDRMRSITRELIKQCFPFLEIKKECLPWVILIHQWKLILLFPLHLLLMAFHNVVLHRPYTLTSIQTARSNDAQRRLRMCK